MTTTPASKFPPRVWVITQDGDILIHQRTKPLYCAPGQSIVEMLPLAEHESLKSAAVAEKDEALESCAVSFDAISEMTDLNEIKEYAHGCAMLTRGKVEEWLKEQARESGGKNV
jgi:hypothetical protein